MKKLKGSEGQQGSNAYDPVRKFLAVFPENTPSSITDAVYKFVDDIQKDENDKIRCNVLDFE